MFPSDYRRIARQRLAGSWALSIGVALVAAILGGLAGGAKSGIDFDIDSDTVQYIRALPHRQFFYGLASCVSGFSLAQFILGGPVELGHCTFLLNQHDQKQPVFQDLFSHFYRFGAGFCLRLLTVLYTALWSLLFIIPGIVASYRYAMAPFILAEHPEYTASEAITASKEMMHGHKLDLFLLDLSFLGWALLSILTLGIGALWLNPYASAARAAFYRDISQTYKLGSLHGPQS